MDPNLSTAFLLETITYPRSQPGHFLGSMVIFRTSAGENIFLLPGTCVTFDELPEIHSLKPTHFRPWKINGQKDESIPFGIAHFQGAFAVSFREGTPPNLPYSSSFPLPSWLPLEHASWTLVGWRDEPPQLGEKNDSPLPFGTYTVYIYIYAHIAYATGWKCFLMKFNSKFWPHPKKTSFKCPVRRCV